jgi:hypothetical protein
MLLKYQTYFGLKAASNSHTLKHQPCCLHNSSQQGPYMIYPCYINGLLQQSVKLSMSYPSTLMRPGSICLILIITRFFLQTHWRIMQMPFIVLDHLSNLFGGSSIAQSVQSATHLGGSGRPTNGYKKIHALKFQAVRLPNGLFGHLFGPVEGQHNDNDLLTESRLLNICAIYALHRGANENTPIHQCFLQLFGDPAYGLGPCILSPFSGGNWTEEELEWNAAMSAVWIEVEHGFGNVTHLWPFLNAQWKHQVYASPVGWYYCVRVLLTNMHNCIQPNQTSQYFSCEPPVLEEYFHH